jgi:hypothetical protein
MATDDPRAKRIMAEEVIATRVRKLADAAVAHGCDPEATARATADVRDAVEKYRETCYEEVRAQ